MHHQHPWLTYCTLCGTLTACESPADVIFALDSSGSIEEENYYIMENFVRDVISSLDIGAGTRVGLITFSSDTRVGVSSCNNNYTAHDFRS